MNNKEWAKSLVPYANWDTRDYAVTSHPAVLDGFTNQARRYVERDREPDKALADKLSEMSVIAQICGELGRKDVVEWNEETGAVMIVDGEQRLEGKCCSSIYLMLIYSIYLVL